MNKLTCVGTALSGCGAYEEGRVVVRVEQVNFDGSSALALADIRIHIGLPLEGAHVHPDSIGSFSVELGRIFDANPAAARIDLEGTRVIMENILELSILALIRVCGEHLEHCESRWQILDDSNVVHVILELRWWADQRLLC